MTDVVVVERSNGVATLTMNRPDALNALDVALKEALRDSLLEAADDPAVRCVVLTGAGRAFCVGQDLREHVTALREHSLDEVWSTVPEHYVPIAEALVTMPKPVVAGINGVAAGAGASIAFACDLRLMADNAGINLAFANIGLSADTGATWTLPRLVGRAKAMELLLLPRTVPADEALELGLATQVVPADQLPAAAGELAVRLAAGPTVAYGAIKRAVAFSASHPFPEALVTEGELMALTGSTQDHRDAVAAFVAKQPPTFLGR